MSFDYPWVLWGFGIFIPLELFGLFSRITMRKRKLSGELRLRLAAQAVFFRLFIACFIMALAAPRWGTAQAAGEYRRGLDAVFAIDVSRSMEIEDCPAFGGETGELSRLGRSLSILREAAASVPGARFAAAAGRGRGLLAVPLTWDNGAVLDFLEALDGSALSGGGTNLESLLDAASGAFQSSFPSRRMILLVSDGEALSGSVRAALDRCAAKGIVVSALAAGSDEGRPVPPSADGSAGGSANGSAAGSALSEDAVPVSRRDSAVMRMAAGRTGGMYIDGSRDDAAPVLAAHLRSLAPESRTGGGREQKQRWPLFVIAAIIAFGASKLSLLKPGGGR